MTTKEAKAKVEEIVRNQLGLSNDIEVTDGKSIAEDLGADTLDGVEIVMRIEEEFNITIDDDVAENINTFGDLFDVVRHRLDELGMLSDGKHGK